MQTDYENKAKRAAYMREYMRTHPEQRKKQIERQKKKRAQDPDIRKREYIANRESYLRRQREYREKNPEKIKAYEQKRYLGNPNLSA